MTWAGLIIIMAIMFILVLSGVPMWMPFVVAPLILLVFYYPGIDIAVIFNQTVLEGLEPLPLTAVPTFIFAANIICRGQGANRLVDFIKSWIGHLPGGMAICTAGGCTMFGAVSGSVQATVVAIGKPLRPPLLEAGYSSPWAFGIIISSASLAALIPPSIAAIIYGVAAEVSIGALFLAGVGSGLLVFALFSIYSIIYSKIKGIGTFPEASWTKRFRATTGALPLFGFPVIILGGIFSGIFTPTEAAASSVVYAIVVEKLIYRELSFKGISQAALQTGMIMGIVLFLVALGRFMSWTLSYSGVPQMIFPHLLGTDPTQLRVIIMVLVSYLIACMFIDSIIAIFVLTPLFAGYVLQLGIDPVFLGAVVILQCAIGACTPPFGINIFTAVAVFQRPYWEVTKGVFSWMAMMLVANIIILIVPDIVLWLPRLMIRGYGG